MANLPTRTLAGVIVPNTPLISKALTYARKYADDFTYNHVVRSWLLGMYIADRVPELQDRDKEVHSVSAILHDLGWASEEAEFITKTKRFEVDGANATREFLKEEGGRGEWDKHRLQLAWDAVALHTSWSLAREKEPEVHACCLGILSDFTGPGTSPGGILTREVWEGVIKEFPRLGFREGIKEKFCGLCRTKPMTTYDSHASDFGAAYVEGYSNVGYRDIDIVAEAED